ncbi:hypothetical protein [Streptomyces sp. MUSC 125]|uniref:hypothetical protein n=1 Tax=Streptomyces sp. MUSC 125 TaxID=1428624 RepID=UPI000AFF1410|nr:hypothetical protein [Streptomyces sp. MUSC 125]
MPLIYGFHMGWMNHCGQFYQSALYPFLACINSSLARCIRRKRKPLAGLRKVDAARWF